MSVEVGSAYVTILPSAKGFAGKLQSEMGGGLATAGSEGGKKFGGGLLASAKSFVGPLAGMFAAAGAVNFLKGSIDEAREAQKVGALSAQVIKTTGGAANVTAQQVGDLATAISNKTGIDDEQIQSSANMLLTFKNVRNEVGKGNDVFNQATTTVTDMSAALGQDTKASAIQLGKALNDPIKGITALGRVGVTFNEQQKKQIKTMVESGDTLGAQKIILKELNSEFGGAAEASATAGEKFATTFGNFKEAVGSALLPILDVVLGKASEFVGYLTDNLGPVMGRVGAFIKPVVAGVKGLFDLLFKGDFTGAKNLFGLEEDSSTVDTLFRIRDTFMEAFATVRAAVVSAIPVVKQFVTGTLIPLFRQAATFITTQLIPRVLAIYGAINGFLTVVIPIVREFVTGMIARIQPLMPTIMAIFVQIGAIITSALELVKAVIERVTTVIQFIWRNWGESIMNFLGNVWAKALVIIQAALTIIQGVIKTVTSLIKGDWSGAWDGIKMILSGAWDLIKGVISNALFIIRSVLSAAWELIKRGAGAAWDKIASGAGAMKDSVVAKLQSLVDWVRSVPGRIVDSLGNLGRTLFGAGKDLIQGLLDGAASLLAKIGSFFLDKVPAFIREPFKAALGIHSPSRVFRDFGVNTMEGYLLGVDDMQRRVDSRIGGIVSTPAVPTFAPALAGGAGAGGAGGPSFTIYQQPNQSAPELVSILMGKYGWVSS